MNRKKKCVGFLLTMLITVLLSMTVLAGTGIKLSLVANHNSAKDLGHAFLVINNRSGRTVYLGDYKIFNGEDATIGLRAGSPWVEKMGGAYINVEAFQAEVYKKFVYLSCEVDQKKLNQVANLYQKRSQYDAESAKVVIQNCTTAAVEAWNKVCPFKYKLIWDNIPADLKLQIKLFPSHKSGTSLIGCGLLRKKEQATNVYFMSKTGILIPLSIPEKISGEGKNITTGNSIKVRWKKTTGIRNKHVSDKVFCSGYMVYYWKVGSSTKSKKYVSGISLSGTTLTGLERGTNYKIAVFPAHKYSADGKSGYVCSEIGQAYTVKTNKVRLKKQA